MWQTIKQQVEIQRRIKSVTPDIVSEIVLFYKQRIEFITTLIKIVKDVSKFLLLLASSQFGPNQQRKPSQIAPLQPLLLPWRTKLSFGNLPLAAHLGCLRILEESRRHLLQDNLVLSILRKVLLPNCDHYGQIWRYFCLHT